MISARNIVRRPSPGYEHPFDRLNRAELKVLQQLSIEATDLEIAQRLNVTEQAVEGHVAQILDKLELISRRDATRLARRNGLRAA